MSKADSQQDVCQVQVGDPIRHIVYISPRLTLQFNAPGFLAPQALLSLLFWQYILDHDLYLE